MSFLWHFGCVESSLREGFSADEAIFTARIVDMKDCFVVPPRNDDYSIEVCHLIVQSKGQFSREISVQLTD
ncbi:hypothetical protein QFZ20_000224 [Flavobacterium sp. W4I14]|nr:hypothetical protein [Flavobacterium sp. W4I14]